MEYHQRIVSGTLCDAHLSNDNHFPLTEGYEGCGLLVELHFHCAPHAVWVISSEQVISGEKVHWGSTDSY